MLGGAVVGTQNRVLKALYGKVKERSPSRPSWKGSAHKDSTQLRSDSLLPNVRQPTANGPINTPDPEVPEKRHAENSPPPISCACGKKPNSVCNPLRERKRL